MPNENSDKAGSGTAVALRLIRLLRHIPREPRKITCTELIKVLEADGISIERRTVERQLAALKGPEFGLGCDDHSKPQGWFRLAGAQALSIADMSPAEALALYLGNTYLSELLPPAMRNQIQPFLDTAEHTLRFHKDTRKTAWKKKVAMVPTTQPLLPPPHNPEVEGVVYQALLDGKQLDIEYVSAYRTDKVPSEHTIHPLGLVQRGPVTYLVVRYYDYADIKILALHRIRKATASVADAVVPEGFSLAEYVEHGEFGFDGTNELIPLKLELRDDVAAFLAETPLSADQEIIRTKEKTVLMATVRSNIQLERWLLSLGAGVKVIGPAPLRKSVVQRIRAAAELY